MLFVRHTNRVLISSTQKDFPTIAKHIKLF